MTNPTDTPLTFTYTNYRNETSVRRINAATVQFRHGSTEWHPEPQWLLSAIDLDKGARRDFAWRDIRFGGDPTDTPRDLVLVPREPTPEMIEAGERELGPWIVPAMHAGDAYAAMIAAAPPVPEPFQTRVWPWLVACFGEVIASDRLERSDRLLEEVMELLQATGYPRERVAALEGYVYGREPGEPAQEVGGVMVTLAAFCLAHGIDMHDAGEVELARVWTKVEAIRAKQAAKPVGSALPVVAPPVPADAASLPEPEATARAHLARLIQTRLLGVRPDDQDVDLEDTDWRLILAALAAAPPAPDPETALESTHSAAEPVGYVNESFYQALLQHKGSVYWHGQHVCGKPFNGCYPIYVDQPDPEAASLRAQLAEATARADLGAALLKPVLKYATKLAWSSGDDYRADLQRAQAWLAALAPAGKTGEA